MSRILTGAVLGGIVAIKVKNLWDRIFYKPREPRFRLRRRKQHTVENATVAAKSTPAKST